MHEIKGAVRSDSPFSFRIDINFPLGKIVLHPLFRQIVEDGEDRHTDKGYL